MRYAAAAILAMAALFFASGEAQAQPQVFTDVRAAATATGAQRERIRIIQAERGSGPVQIARLSAAVLRAARPGRTVQLQVTPTVSVMARALRASTDNGVFIWTGEVLSRARARPPGASNILVSGGDISGTIRTADGRVYQLRPLGNLEAAIVEIDFATLPPDHADEYPIQDARGAGPRTLQLSREAVAGHAAFQRRLDSYPRLRRWATAASEFNLAQTYALAPQFWALPVEMPEITVLVAYTASAQAHHGNVTLLAADAVWETTQSFFNSKALVRIRLVGAMQVIYADSFGAAAWDQTYIDFLGAGDGQMDEIHAQRDALGADVVVLITNNDHTCGTVGNEAHIGATAATAYAMVYHKCATGNYSFGHEIGHLMGARHNVADDPGVTPFAWGHGYRHGCAATDFRTIMARYCGSGPLPPRLQFWSSPFVLWNGVPMGGAAQEHVARVWTERAFEVSMFR